MVTLVGSLTNKFKLNSPYMQIKYIVALSIGCSACYAVISQLVSPRRIIAFLSLSRHKIACSSLLKEETGLLDGLYRARTKNDVLFGNNDMQSFTQMISSSSIGASGCTVYLIECPI